MASDVQWQIDNGYGCEVMGDFSVRMPEIETPMFGRYFDTFQAAVHVAKAFPGSKLEPSEYENETGAQVHHYYVDSQPYFDRLLAEQVDTFVYDEYPAAVHTAECIDQASKEADVWLFDAGYTATDDTHASPTILD